LLIPILPLKQIKKKIMKLFLMSLGSFRLPDFGFFLNDYQWNLNAERAKEVGQNKKMDKDLFIHLFGAYKILTMIGYK
jgi:hypothetical protein